MSDFLDNLIAKNTAVGNAKADGGARASVNVNTIRPYLPSRFESAASPPAPHDFAGATEFEIDAETTPQAGRASSFIQQQDERLAPTPHAFERRGEDVSPEPRRTTRDGDAPHVEVRHVPVEEQTPAPRPAEPLMRETLTEHVLLVERETERRVETAVAPTRRQTGFEVAPSTLLIVEHRHEVEARDAGERRGAASDDESLTTTFAPAESARVRDDESFVPSRREARGSVNARQQQPDARPSAGPDVHVTIGRVEVRAASSPPTKPARRGGPQPMTLEEYQRRRTSGEHR